MTLALVVLGYMIGVLLVVTIFRVEVKLDQMEKRRVSYDLYLTPNEVVDLLKRDPMEQYFSARPRGQA